MTGQRIRIELWAQHWCDRCWNPDQVLKRKDYRGSGCPLLAAALQGAVPAEWEPAPRKVAEAKDPQQFRRLTEELWRQSFDCLKTVAESQMRDVQAAMQKTYEVASKTAAGMKG